MNRIDAVHVMDINMSLLEALRASAAPCSVDVTQRLWAASGKEMLPLKKSPLALQTDKPVWLISEVDWVAE
ncbi:hypothetical protein, partial [Acetobacter nitrogenifigens]|uniref:hypothetical protein n=1 Tax=Acetobacter nitrogenifigens TaxID=285268 RepID=UPI001C3FBEAC